MSPTEESNTSILAGRSATFGTKVAPHGTGVAPNGTPRGGKSCTKEPKAVSNAFVCVRGVPCPIIGEALEVGYRFACAREVPCPTSGEALFVSRRSEPR